MAHPRGRLRFLAAVAAALALWLGALAVRPKLERILRARIEAEAAQRGLVVRIDAVRVGLWPPLRLTGVALQGKGRWRLNADTVELWWPGRKRVVIENALVQGPAGLTLAAASTTWDISGISRDDFRIALNQPQSGLVVNRTSSGHASTWAIAAKDLGVGSLVDVRRFDRPVLYGGIMSGSLTVETSADVVHFDLDGEARGARLPALAGDGSEPEDLGAPTALGVQVAGSWKRTAGALDIPRWSATIAGAALSGSLGLRDLDTEPSVDLSLDVERVDFARLLRTSGLEIPEDLGLTADAARGNALGSATLVARAQGRISDPASFVVTQRLDFTPPTHLPPAIVRLRGGFVHEARQGSAARMIDVSVSSPDFIPLAEVPPLFRRALLLAEDAGFYSHHGIDLREVPAALLTDWARGGAARGASTITQQLAKNLFLSHEKQLGRKLQELPITLLLESALSKDRILEIYLNVIEWGPGLFGLRPAAQTYFGTEPQELTPAQMAFLVSIIPAPVKYQFSFADGTPGPGLRRLMDALLAKLRSVDALTEDEYQQALEEEIVIQGRERAPGTG